jgi:hypothetical protein
MMRKGLVLLLLCFLFHISYAYKLPNYYNPKEDPLTFEVQKDDTYQVYLNYPSLPHTLIYHTQPVDLERLNFGICNSSHYCKAFYFYYVNNRSEIVFLNNKGAEASNPYSDMFYIFQDKYNILASPNDNNNLDFIIVQPVFKSQPKVWILILREFKTIFIGYPASPKTSTEFLENGNLYLVDSVEMDPDIEKMGVMHPTATENILIDYSIFEKTVKKPTCYMIPESHKMRPCTPEEAKLRTPALRVFLGEASVSEALKENRKKR